jgi:hypothetical protein
MNDGSALENVRRYRTIASLCRQTAAFRPEQRLSLLQQAEDWECMARRELDAQVETDEIADEDSERQAEPQVDTRWWLPRPEGLFAGLQR